MTHTCLSRGNLLLVGEPIKAAHVRRRRRRLYSNADCFSRASFFFLLPALHCTAAAARVVKRGGQDGSRVIDCQVRVYVSDSDKRYLDLRLMAPARAAAAQRCAPLLPTNQPPTKISPINRCESEYRLISCWRVVVLPFHYYVQNEFFHSIPRIAYSKPSCSWQQRRVDGR